MCDFANAIGHGSAIPDPRFAIRDPDTDRRVDLRFGTE
jgi:hypothetical protein